MRSQSSGVRLSYHCLTRFAERHEKEVDIMLVDPRKGMMNTIFKEVYRSTSWYDPERDTIYLIYNKLRVYIGRLTDRRLQILTEYPYRKGIKRRLSSFRRIENPLNEKGVKA